MNYINTNITPDVCVGTWMFAEKYQIPVLAHTACAMASDEFDQVIQCDEVLQLSKAMLLVVLGSQRKLNMDDLCRTILRWVEHDAEGRQGYFSELLPFISFPQLSPVYISELMNYYFDHPFRKHLASKSKPAAPRDCVCVWLKYWRKSNKKVIQIMGVVGSLVSFKISDLGPVCPNNCNVHR